MYNHKTERSNDLNIKIESIFDSIKLYHDL
jgi:hypothetical protein